MASAGRSYGNSSDDYGLYKAVQKASASTDTPQNWTSPWDLGAQWLTGSGPRHQDFHDNDPFTQLLRKHTNIADDVSLARSRFASGDYRLGQPLGGDYDYSLGGLDGFGKYFGDYATLVDGGATGNLAVTFLGSYNVSITPIKVRGPHKADALFVVNNASTLASATHLPLYGIIPGYDKVGEWENSLVPTGPMSKTTQTISWTQEITW